MTDRKTDKVVTALVSGAVGIAVQKALPVPGIGGLAARVSSVVLEGWLKDRRERFWTDFLESGTPAQTAVADFEAEFEKKPKDTRELVLGTLIDLENALCEETMPHFALLLRSYYNQDKPRDLFFLGTSRVLRDILSKDELDALKEVVTYAAEKWPRSTEPRAARTISRVNISPSAQAPELRHLYLDNAPGNVGGQNRLKLREQQVRPISLLETNGLLRETPADNGVGLVRVEKSWQISYDDCRRLAHVLNLTEP